MTRKLEDINRAMDSMTARDGVADFLNNPENAQKINGLVEDVRYALMDYQVCTPSPLALIISNISLRYRYDEISTKRVVRRL